MEKVLLVVGASSDMGIATIERVVNNYSKVICHYNHINDGLEKLKVAYESKIVLVKADLSNASELENMIDEINQMELTPNHIIHFPAPLCQNKHYHKIKWDIFEKEINISLKSIVRISQEYLPKMAKADGGKLILMLSYVINNLPPKHCANYVVVKYALLGLMKSLSVEYADKGITVNGVSPAWVMTKYISNQPDFLIEQNAELSPIGRILTVNDIVPSIEYLLSDGANCVNGQNIVVSCGR